MSTPRSAGPNWFAIIVTTICALIIGGIAAFTVSSNIAASEPVSLPEEAVASGVVDEDGGILLNEAGGGRTVDVYFDPLCPACKNFEALYMPSIKQAADAEIRIHPIGALNHLSQGTRYPTRAAASVYAVAVADPTAVADYVALLFELQPSEGSPGWSNTDLASYAKQFNVTITEEDIKRYERYIDTVTLETPRSAEGRIQTPTLVIDGEVIPITGDTATDLAKLN